MKPLKYHTGMTFISPDRSSNTNVVTYRIISSEIRFTGTDFDVTFEIDNNGKTSDSNWTCSLSYLRRMISEGYLVLVKNDKFELPEDLFTL